jgi:hypothetical protein
MIENIQKIQVKETEDLGWWNIEDQPIEQFISKLQSYIDRGYTTISCDIWGDSPYFKFIKFREETDIEYQNRVDKMQEEKRRRFELLQKLKKEFHDV